MLGPLGRSVVGTPGQRPSADAVFGGLGVAGYLGYLAGRVFKDSLLFPFALSLIGLAIIALGVLWQRHEAEWSARLRNTLPKALRELLEARAA